MTPYRAPVRHRKSRYNDRQGIFDYILTVLKYVILAVAVLFVISLSRKAYSTGYRVFAESAVDTRENAKTVTITVKEGMNKSLWPILGLFFNFLAAFAFMIVLDRPSRIRKAAQS